MRVAAALPPTFSEGWHRSTDLSRSRFFRNAEQLLREANLRYSLVRLRENAESIAFYQGESQEGDEIKARLGGAIENRRAILGTQRNLEFFTVGYSFLIQILPVLVVSPLYFAGSIELGVITQSTGAFNHVLNDLSIIVNQVRRSAWGVAAITLRSASRPAGRHTPPLSCMATTRL